jgi:uncharacterized protein with GYD domain
MTKLAAEDEGRRERGQAWKKKVEHVVPGIKWMAHYAMLGPYDFMDIYEAPNDAAAFKVSLLSRSEGAVRAESWPAMRYEAFLELNDQIEVEHAKLNR